MKFPKKIKIGSVIFRVTDNKDEWMKLENRKHVVGLLGHMDSSSGIIYLKPEQVDDQKRLTLWHEVLHALLNSVSGVPHWENLGDDEEEREERVVRIFESPTLCVLRDNPKLVEYLTAK